MQLRYEIDLVGMDRMKRVLRGAERELQAHARTTAAMVRRETGVAPARGRPQNNARHFEQVALAARAAYLKEGREQIAAARRVEAEKIRGIRRVEAEQRKASAKAERDAIAAARRAETAHTRSLVSAQRAKARAAERAGSGFVGSVGGAGRNIVGLGGTALALGGGLLAGNALQTEISERAIASKLANQAGKPQIKGDLLNRARSVRGFTGAEALGGLEAFVTKTGDLDMGLNILDRMSQKALATGTDLTDLGEATGQIFNVLKDQIQDPVKLVEELDKAMGSLAQQGALGAVEIRDLAREAGKLGAATRAFEGDSPRLVRTMGAMAQLAVARGGAPSAAEASTGAARLASDIVMNRKKFAALGVNIKSKVDPTKLAPIEQIMADVLDKTGGDITKTAGLFGEVSGTNFRGMSAVFTAAEARQKGSGRSAMLAELERFAGANLSDADIKKRAESRLSDEDLKIKENVKRFNAAVGTELVPVVNKLIPELAKMAPLAGRAAKGLAELTAWAVDNPFKGLGAIIAVAVAKDIATAGVGKLAGAAVSGLVSRMPGFVPGGAVAAGGAAGAKGGGFMGRPAPGASMAAAGMGAAIGLTIGTAILTAGIVNFEAGEAQIKQSGSDLERIRSMTSPESAEEARKIVERQREIVAKERRGGMVAGVFGRGFAESIGVEDPAQLKTQENFLTEMETRLAKLEALKDVADKMSKAGATQEKAAEMLAAAAQRFGLPGGGGGNRSGSPIVN